MNHASKIFHTEISIFITVSNRGLKATVAIQSVTSKSISEIIGVELKEIRGYRTPPRPHPAMHYRNKKFTSISEGDFHQSRYGG